jgi:hypothetical protein
MGPHRLTGIVGLVLAALASPATRADVAPAYTVADADWKREEARAMRRPPKRPRIAVARATPSVVRHRGKTPWSLDDVARLDASFRAEVGRSLPISAYGQTDLHTGLGYDHSGAVDVALHPESREGLALQRLLRDAGIPFITAHRSVHGVATGAHIHIGTPSRRLTAIASSRP